MSCLIAELVGALPNSVRFWQLLSWFFVACLVALGFLAVRNWKRSRLAETLSGLDRDFLRIQAECDDLKQQQELMQTLLASMIEGVIAFDDSERLLFANSSALTLLEIEEKDSVGSLMVEVTRDPVIQKGVRQSLAGHDESTVEILVSRTEKTLQMTTRRLVGDPCPGIVVIFHDVTELRRLEKTRSEFVANVSHELKTPLSSITAYSETLLAGALDDSDHNRRFVQQIDEQAKRLDELIGDLLNLARIEAQQTRLQTQSVAVEPVAARCVEDHLPLVVPGKVRLVLDPPTHPVSVQATVHGLRIILGNLLVNAIKFTTDGTIRLSWRSVGDHVHIVVEDTGMGISEENQERVFERFFRIDAGRSRDSGGTGLGLAIVKHMSQSLGGRVGLTAELGKGSCFTVILSRADS